MTEPRSRGRPRAFNDRTEQNRVQALDRGLEILRLVAEGAGLTLTEIAQKAGEAPATVYRALITLQGHGMVELEEPGQLWQVSGGAFRIGSHFLRRTKVVERARQPMEQLMRATGETANLGIEQQDRVLFLSQVETHEAIRAFFPPGTRSAMHVSGIGKALLAWFPPDRIAQIAARNGLEGHTPNSLTSLAALEADLAATRRRGYSIDNEERTEGMRCIAAPIFNPHGEPVAGLSVSGPSFRMDLNEAPRLGALVREAADRVTEATGGRCPGPETLATGA